MVDMQIHHCTKIEVEGIQDSYKSNGDIYQNATLRFYDDKGQILELDIFGDDNKKIEAKGIK